MQLVVIANYWSHDSWSIDLVLTTVFKMFKQDDLANQHQN